MTQAILRTLTAIALGASALAQAPETFPFDGAAPISIVRTFSAAVPQDAQDAAAWDLGRADSIPPAGVEFARPIGAGQWRVSYSYERQALDGLRSGRTNLSSDEVFARGFTTVPLDATFQTHQLDVVHGLGDGWGLFAGLPIVDREMDNLTSTGDTFTTRASGIGDFQLGGFYDWHAGDGDLLRFSLGLSIPTGAVDERGTDENGASFLLPYSMQLGSGTHDLLPGVTYLMQHASWTLGLQALGRFYVDTNSEGWSNARRFSASAWASKGWTRDLSTSLRIEGLHWSDVQGHAQDADPTRNPIEATTTQGGDRLDAALGLQWLLGDGAASNNLLTAEAAVPVDEWLKGPQLSTEWTLMLGWQFSF